MDDDFRASLRGRLRDRTDMLLDAMMETLGRPESRTLRDMEELTDQIRRRELVIEILQALVPRRADQFNHWWAWLNGGQTPKRALSVNSFTDKPEASGRAASRACKKAIKADQTVDEARRRLETARAELSLAERAVEEAERMREEDLANAQATLGWAYLREIASVSSGIFAMGPAWTLLRILSGYLQEDAEWEGTLTYNEREQLTQHRLTRKRRSEEMLTWLDSCSGDPAIEWRLFDELYSLMKRAERADARRRSDDNRRNSVHPNAPTKDAADVLFGVERPPA